MSVFSFPCSHAINITQTSTFGYLNPPSKASGIAVALFQETPNETSLEELTAYLKEDEKLDK